MEISWILKYGGWELPTEQCVFKQNYKMATGRRNKIENLEESGEARRCWETRGL